MTFKIALGLVVMYFSYKFVKGVCYVFITRLPWKRKSKYVLKMSHRDFEFYCADIYKAMGYHAEVTPAVNDGGKDIIVKKGRHKEYIECKHFNEHGVVGRPIANKLAGVMAHDKISKGAIITTGRFTKECVEFAKDMNIECIDFNKLMKMTKRYK